MSAAEPWIEIVRPQNRIGKTAVILDNCDSTNDVAMELARSGYPDGSVVIAKHQVRGKGRLGRTWESWPGNLALSVIVRPDLAMDAAHRLVFASAYAAIDALESCGARTLIKWPNDILIKPEGAAKIEKLGPFRKVGGILLELTSTDQKIDAAVIGIGLNLRRPDCFRETRMPQIGFIEDLGKTPSLNDLVNKLLDALEGNLACLSNPDYLELLAKVKTKSALLGKQVYVECGPRVIHGIAEDLSIDGALVIKDSDGNREKIYFGDVHLA